MSKWVVLIPVLGLAFLFGCQEQQRLPEQPVYQPPPEHYQQPDDRFDAETPEQQRQIYFTQGQQQLAQMQNAIYNLEQVVEQLRIQRDYEPYRRTLDRRLDRAIDRLVELQEVDQRQLDAAVGELVSAIDALLNAYEQAAIFVQQHAGGMQQTPGM